MPEYIPIAPRAKVPEGRGITVHAAGRNIALFNVQGEIHALDGICPHKGGPLGEGHCEDGKVFCPMHGWAFDIRSGDCLDFPGRSAQRIPVRIQGDMIEAAL